MQPSQSIMQAPYTTTTHTAIQTDQSETNAQIVPIVPNLCININRKEALDECLTRLGRTKTIGCNHKACVCIICDYFIIGVENMCWLSDNKLKA